MKTIKLTESTLKRIVERIINEQGKEEAMKTLQSYFDQMKTASAEERKGEEAPRGNGVQARKRVYNHESNFGE